MDLGISVKSVIEAKFGPYLDTLSQEDREKKLNSYIEAAGSSLEGAIKEAEALVDSVQSTCTSIISAVPTTIAQVASLVTMIDPTAKAAQLITITQTVSNLKDQLKRASSQVESLSNLLVQLSMSNQVVDSLKTAISTASSLLNTIPV